jgi:sugar phosphate isomerase/epimerase
MIGGLSRKAAQEEFEFWAIHKVDFMMISIAWDFFLEDDNIVHVEKLKSSYGFDILIHPREDGNILLSPGNPGAHDLIFEALDRIRELISSGKLIDKLIIHLPIYHIPSSSYQVFTEEEAFLNARPFYERLQSYSDLTFVLENGYPPDKGWGGIGYLLEHFTLLGLGSNYEFCLDTGHLNLSSLSIQDILSLPYNLTCFHLHSNDGESDQHLPLTRENFSSWPQLLDLLTSDKYIVLEVKNHLGKITDVLEHIRRNDIAPK